VFTRGIVPPRPSADESVLGAATTHATDVPRQSKALVVQPTEVADFLNPELRPSAEERRDAVVSHGSLDHELVVVECC